MKNTSRNIVFTFFILTIALGSCTLLERTNDDPPVARVLDNYLYRSDLLTMIPEGTSKEDSAAIVKAIIDTWIRKQLLLNKAEEALTEQQKDVEKKIEEYRSSLLIYSYRQKLLNQKMDTVVDMEDIKEYYDNNIDNFILNEDIVKVIFVKVPLSAPNISNVRSWMRSSSEESLDNLEKYCMKYADKFDVFDHSWIYFSKLMEKVPLVIDEPSRYLRYNKSIETSDSMYHYFVRILDHKTAGTATPLDLIHEEIRSILLNKRKIEFFHDLEKQVYSEAANRNQFEIY